MNSIDEEQTQVCANAIEDSNANDASQIKGTMQTIIPTYVGPSLEEADSRLLDSNNYNPLNETYHLEQYKYIHEDLDKRLSPDKEDINVDVEDKLDEEVNIADDNIPEDAEDSSNSALQEESRLVIEEDNRNVNNDDFYEPSWHPHVYGKPPKKPTPHTIEYILGLTNEKCVQNDVDLKRIEIRDIRVNNSVSSLVNVKRNFDSSRLKSKLIYPEAKREFSIQTSLVDVDRKKVANYQRNKVLQEQLRQRTARTSMSDTDGVYDNSKVLDPVQSKSDVEPLNLSVPKVKDPVWSAAENDKGISKGT